MPSREELQRRKALARDQTAQAQTAAVAALPLPLPELGALFDHLDAALENGCDHSLALTTAFLRERGLAEERVVPWLQEQGGYCDCEVLANVEQQWED